MNNAQMKDIFYRYLTYFLVCSFLGWVFETGAVFLMSGHVTERGYFFIGPRLASAFHVLPMNFMTSVHIIWGLPAIEMYGIGSLILIITLKKIHNQIFKVFVLSAIYMTIFELFGSYWCSAMLHHSFWNYNHEFLNFQGRICLQSSLAWGALGVLVIQTVEPWLEKLYLCFKDKKYTHQVLLFLGVYVIICALFKYVFYPNIISH